MKILYQCMKCNYIKVFEDLPDDFHKSCGGRWRNVININ